MFGYKVTYSNCWAIALTSEFIFILPEFIKILWFTVVVTDPTYNEVRMFYPLSLSNFFDFEEIDKRYVYPLKALNLFEPIYWLMLINGVHAFARKQVKIAAYIVLSSYVLLFLLWILFYIIVYD